MSTTYIITELRNALFSGKGCKEQFERYDVFQLESSTEPFLWYCDNNCTHLVYIGATEIARCLSTERMRIAVFRDFYSPLGAITYYSKTTSPYRLLYWDGRMLCAISFEEAFEIWRNVFETAYKKAKKEHMKEFLAADEPLEIVFDHPDTEKAFAEVQTFAAKLGDASLDRCIECVKKYTRCGVNHYICILRDYMGKSFYFAEMLDDEMISNGGIIYSPDKRENCWQIHT